MKLIAGLLVTLIAISTFVSFVMYSARQYKIQQKQKNLAASCQREQIRQYNRNNGMSNVATKRRSK